MTMTRTNMFQFVVWYMNYLSVDTVLPVVVAGVLLAGIIFITITDTLITTIGVLLVILGLMGLMPAVHLWLTNDPSLF